MAGSPHSLASRLIQARTSCGIPPSSHQVPYCNIGDLLRKQAERYGEKIWLIFYSEPDTTRRFRGGRETYTYAEFYACVSETAELLLSRGISGGDRIATVAYNHADTAVQYFAAWLIGAVVVPINVAEDDKRIGYMLQNSNAKLAFVRTEFIDRVNRIVADAAIELAIIHTDPVETHDHHPSSLAVGNPRLRAGNISNHQTPVSNPQSPIPNLPEVSLEDDALIVYTSGTTGLPKGVVLSQYNLLVDARAISDWHGMTPDQRMMCVLPIHHVNGTVVTLMTPMYYGGSVVLNQKFHSGSFFRRVVDENVGVVSVVPTLLQFLLAEQVVPSAFDLSKFRHIICGAGPLTCELAEKFEDHFGIAIIHGYGLSETTCYSCFLPIDMPADERRRWLTAYGFPSIGVPISSNEMTIHDEHGVEQREGVRGEIVIRGHNVMKGYFANPDANEKTFSHGWFRSGDEGFYKTDARGRKFFFITGRLKELIIRGGVNISPFEIDEVLMNMPGVKAGLAVGFENEWYGEEVGAYVQPLDGTALTEDAVISYCRKCFSFQKSPKVVIFGNDIPVTSTGKYQRNKLKPLFGKWKSVQFKDRREGSSVEGRA